MADYIDRRNPLDPKRMEDPALRNVDFRGMAKDLVSSIRSGGVTDAPGEAARLMEKAFRAGLALRGAGKDVINVSRDKDRRMSDRDLPVSAVKALEEMRRLCLGYRTPPSEGPYKRPPHAILMMQSRRATLASPIKVEWLFVPKKVAPRPLPNKYVSPLIKQGLLVERDIPGGLRVAVFSEWGYELYVTGETALPKNRVEHGSVTVQDWIAMFEGDWLKNFLLVMKAHLAAATSQS